VFVAQNGFKSITLNNQDAYPCTSNLGVTCEYWTGITGNNQNYWNPRVVVRFKDASYATTKFHLLIPDTPDAQYNNYHWFKLGVYNKLTKDYTFTYAGQNYRQWNYWATSLAASPALNAGIVGKAGSYKQNMTVNVYNPNPVTNPVDSFILLCTQWSLFENGVTVLSAATLAMASPATFTAVDDKSPLALYVANGMYLTVIPFSYVSGQVSFTFWLDKAHMPYTYDLPSYYIYTVRSSDLQITSANALIMANGNTLYQSPLQSLVVTCQDNALGVVSTYCTATFGTSHPLLASGRIRLSLAGLTVSTATCALYFGNGTQIPVVCASSSDNQNLTVNLTGWEFYPTGTFSLIFYGVGISNASLSQAVTLYLYDANIQYVIETGVRILTTTIAGLSYISLTEILYAYLNPLSYNTMTINFYLPRPLYEDEEFAFVIGEDLSDVNT
jgi:hypothetical protein